MKIHNVFTPGRYPSHTYVKRSNSNFEEQVANGIAASEIVSISGPSKSGKTVLVQRVFGKDDLIEVRGAQINSINDLWNQILDELNAPDETESTDGESTEESKRITGKISSRIPGIGGEIEGSEGSKTTSKDENTKIRERSGLRDVLKIIDTDNDVVFIDDFHYIERNIQKEIAQSLKEALYRGLSICVALVPHRSEDIERANSDLRGRVKHVEMDYWNQNELKKIAEKGFSELNIEVQEGLTDILSLEAAGSPPPYAETLLRGLSTSGC